MTELVRNRVPTPPSIIESLSAVLVASSLALALPVSTAAAAPGTDTASTDEAAKDGPTSEPATGDVPDEAAIRAALGDGDLTTARELAVARSEAEPSPANLELEAEVWLALGDYQNATRAYERALEALPEDEAISDRREAIASKLEAIAAASRGTKADEPESEQRERLDRERAERLAALAPKPPPEPEIVDTPKLEPITKKWYFWVTLGAIVASAGAIVGLAVTAAVEDNQANDASAAAFSSRRRLIPAGGVVLRF